MDVDGWSPYKNREPEQFYTDMEVDTAEMWIQQHGVSKMFFLFLWGNFNKQKKMHLFAIAIQFNTSVKNAINRKRPQIISFV